MKLVSFSGDPGSSKRLGSQRPRYRRVLHLNYICIWHFSSNFTCVLEAGCSLVPACLFAFSHRCININPAVFSSRWRKSMGFLFLYLKWQEGHFFFFFSQVPSISFIFIFWWTCASLMQKGVPSFILSECCQGEPLLYLDLFWMRLQSSEVLGQGCLW